MNTLAYLQYFDGLAEKQQGSFIMEKISSKKCSPDLSGEKHTYHCNFHTDRFRFQAEGNSRKEALRSLYRKLSHFKKFS